MWSGLKFRENGLAKMGTTYRVLIQGVKPTKDVDAVREGISKLFKVSSDVAARLLEAKVHVVKGGLTVERAAQYHAAIEAAGANCVIEPEATTDLDLAARPAEATPAGAGASSPARNAKIADSPVPNALPARKGLSPVVKYGGGFLIAVVVLGIVGNVWLGNPATHDEPSAPVSTAAFSDKASTSAPQAPAIQKPATPQPAAPAEPARPAEAPAPGELLRVPDAERQSPERYLRSLVSQGAKLGGVNKQGEEPAAFANFSNGWLEWSKPGGSANMSRGPAQIFTGPDRTCVGFEQEDKLSELMDPRGTWKQGDPPLREQYLVCIAVREVQETPFLARPNDVFMTRAGDRYPAVYLHAQRAP